MSNSKRVVLEVERKIARLAISLRTGGWTLIETAIAIGEALIEGAVHIPARQLGRWEKAKFGWSKSKTARFRRLARHASLIIDEYNKGTASALLDPLTITGVDTWAQKATGNFKVRSKPSKAGSDGSTSDTDEAGDHVDTADDIAALRRQLREALNRIRELEEKLAHRMNAPNVNAEETDTNDMEREIANSANESAYASYKLWTDATRERGA